MLRSRLFILVVVWLALAAGCTRVPPTAKTPITPKTVAELSDYLLSHKPDVDQFRLRGPFEVTVQTDHEVRLSANERVKKESALYVEADRSLAYDVVITAMAVAKRAGVTKVMMLTDPSEEIPVEDLDKPVPPR